MKTDLQKTCEQPPNGHNRMEELDLTLARLDALIEKNKMELERNNAELALKLAELSRQVEL